ncbi:MAG: chemotaxis protein CheX [Burkholderiales bacterium]|nr:chemotaxis protein CheX [Burkholderiales bacterium]
MMALTELEQDALTEIFNIGVGLAADALYQMTGEHVPLSVPVVELTSQHEAQQHFLAREQRPLCAIRQTYQGAFNTEAVLMFPDEGRTHLVRMMVGDDFPQDQLGEMEQDAMGELGNIILNAVISNLASSLSMRIEGTLPVVSLESADTVLRVQAQTLTGAPDEATQVLALMIDFQLGRQHVGGYLAFLLAPGSSQILLQHLARYVGGDNAC